MPNTIVAAASAGLPDIVNDFDAYGLPIFDVWGTIFAKHKALLEFGQTCPGSMPRTMAEELKALQELVAFYLKTHGSEPEEIMTGEKTWIRVYRSYKQRGDDLNVLEALVAFHMNIYGPYLAVLMGLIHPPATWPQGIVEKALVQLRRIHLPVGERRFAGTRRAAA